MLVIPLSVVLSAPLFTASGAATFSVVLIFEYTAADIADSVHLDYDVAKAVGTTDGVTGSAVLTEEFAGTDGTEAKVVGDGFDSYSHLIFLKH
jgi:hypothetical protein